MITVIAGTNRKNSRALKFAEHYAGVLRQLGEEEVKVLALEEAPYDWFHPLMYDEERQTPGLAALQNEYLIPAQKFVFVIPEYNGSYPGVLKLFIDACSVRESKKTFKGKKAALLGVASGRAGNLLGMDHLTGVLHHLGIAVLPNRQPVASIQKLKNSVGEITDPETIVVIEVQAGELLAF